MVVAAVAVKCRCGSPPHSPVKASCCLRESRDLLTRKVSALLPTHPQHPTLLNLGSEWKSHSRSSLSQLPACSLPPPPQQSSVLDAFPASDQPLSENTMKSMLLSLRQTLYTDLSTAVSSLATTVNQQDQAITQMEAKMGDLLSAHNELVDGFADYDDELQLINMKLADLEDHSR